MEKQIPPRGLGCRISTSPPHCHCPGMGDTMGLISCPQLLSATEGTWSTAGLLITPGQ